jgi:hypothetical protein
MSKNENPASGGTLDGADSKIAGRDNGIDTTATANVQPSVAAMSLIQTAEIKVKAKADAKAKAGEEKAKIKAATEAKAEVKIKEKAKIKAEEKAKTTTDKAAAKAADKAKADAEVKAKAEAQDKVNAHLKGGRDRQLDAMNATYCVVKIGGKVRVMTFDRHVQQVGRASIVRLIPVFMSFSDLANFKLNEIVELDNNKFTSLGQWWLNHLDRLTYNNLIFRPGSDKVIDGNLNLWRGWGVEPKPGDWFLMREHVRVVMTSGKPEMYKYVIRWLAWAVQNPDQRAEVALVFRGGKGVGKGTLGNVMCQMFGQHSIHISNSKYLTGFNSHMRDACFMFADEAYWPGDKSAEGDLKRLVTESSLFIEGKGQDAVPWPNMLHVLMASNEDWIVPASDNERRWVLNEVSDIHIQDPSWFEPIYKQMEEGGTSAMLHDLLTVELDGWHPRTIPANCGLIDQQTRSLLPLDRWYLELLEVGSLTGCDPANPSHVRSGDYEERIKTDDGGYDRFVKRPGLYTAARLIDPRLRSHTSDHAFGAYLREVGATNDKRVLRRTGWVLPGLAVCRAAWEKRFPGTEWRNPGLTEWAPEDRGDDVEPEPERKRPATKF